MEMEEAMSRSTICLATILVGAWAVALAAQEPVPQEKLPLGSRPAPDRMNPSATATFLTTVSQDDRTELAAAKLALEKTADDRVRNLAKTVETDHQNAELQIEQLAQVKKVNLPEADPMQ